MRERHETLSKSSRSNETIAWEKDFNRWWKQGFPRNRVMIDKFSELLGFLDIGEKITVPNFQLFSYLKNEVSCQTYHYVSVHRVLI
ncbi:hypothetical protein IM40_05745 [Candidatus Paracaedimonas acanthamoebae]|nr:hypothetical protein IM40_05745 [Candidatus Paracaedimonas acanthamoebae]